MARCTAALILGSKLKFLLLGLTKASTFVSMFAFFGVYWSVYGWPLALGLVVTIYIHEMGHVAMLRRLGIDSSAPLFIPGMGALVMLRQHITDPVVDAKIGLAGPVWGLGAALAALGAYFATDAGIWLAIAHLTAVSQPVQPDSHLAARWVARVPRARPHGAVDRRRGDRGGVDADRAAPADPGCGGAPCGGRCRRNKGRATGGSWPPFSCSSARSR